MYPCLGPGSTFPRYRRPLPASWASNLLLRPDLPTRLPKGRFIVRFCGRFRDSFSSFDLCSGSNWPLHILCCVQEEFAQVIVDRSVSKKPAERRHKDKSDAMRTENYPRWQVQDESVLHTYREYPEEFENHQQLQHFIWAL